MTASPTTSQSTVHRVADLHLRGPAGPIHSRAFWPASVGTGAAPALLVVLATSGYDPAGLCQWLCASAGVVVLTATCQPASADAIATVEWAADHAAELAADPDRLLVGGEGTGGSLAAAVALHARDYGWPPLRRQVLIRPVFDAALLARPAAGVAPATLVAGERYAGWLRRAGVPVDEVSYPSLVSSLTSHETYQKG